MTKKLLITRAKHNPDNEYLYTYSKEILDVAATEGWVAHKAEDTDATRKNVISRLSGTQYKLVVLNGHGEADLIRGHNDEILLTCDDAALLRGTIVFFRSCDTISGLGRAAADKGGAKAAVGYAEAFSFYGQTGYEFRRLQDPLAKPVLEVSNLVATKLIKGSSVQDAMRTSRREARERVRKLLSHPADQHNLLIIDMLVQNAIALTCAGNELASV
ncbi:MAG: hypothetical protein V1728_03815 [Candidatus Micrarchaeota archaeon]